MEFFKALDFIIISQLIVFIAIIARQKQINKANKVYLLVYMGAILYCLIDRIFFFYHNELNRLDFPHTYHSSDPFKYLFFPSAYLYVKSITNYNFKLRWQQTLHFIPFIVTLVYLLVNYTLLPTAEKYVALYNKDLFTPIPEVWLFDMTYTLQQAYILGGFYLVFQYQKKLKKYVSSLYWYNTIPLYTILMGFVFIYIVRAYTYLVHNVNISIDIDFTLYAIIIVVVGYNQKRLFVSPPLNLDEKVNDNGDEDLKEQIETYMLESKPYLNADITLDKLADELKISSRKLSSILNGNFETNFFNFINTYRIDEAKNILSKPSNSNLTILEVLYQVGFNNKSAFNRVFKEFTGLTPTEFKKQRTEQP